MSRIKIVSIVGASILAIGMAVAVSSALLPLQYSKLKGYNLTTCNLEKVKAFNPPPNCKKGWVAIWESNKGKVMISPLSVRDTANEVQKDIFKYKMHHTYPCMCGNNTDATLFDASKGCRIWNMCYLDVEMVKEKMKTIGYYETLSKNLVTAGWSIILGAFVVSAILFFILKLFHNRKYKKLPTDKIYV